MIGLIWAEAADRVIGNDGVLPWHLPEDLQRFKTTTMGATVVMGRRTWESLPASVRPLPGRRNVVITHDGGYAAPGAEVATSLEAALGAADADVWVIGGASVYAQALPFAERVVRTRIHVQVDGDAHAPELGPEWTLVERDPESGLHASASGLTYCVATLVRR